MKVHQLCLIATFAAVAVSVPPVAAAKSPAASVTLATARASIVGSWHGELQYRDYQSNQWVGIPVTVSTELIGDGATLVRRAVFDDGPKRGAVYITSLELLAADGTSEYATSFRVGNVPELERFALVLMEARDTTHWTIRATAEGIDDDRPAHIRETTTRNGDQLTTLKEVDFTDDGNDEWLQRNRTVLHHDVD